MEQGKNILVISQKDEQSTDKVLQYLLYDNLNFIRINDEDIVQSASVIFDEKENFNLITLVHDRNINF